MILKTHDLGPGRFLGQLPILAWTRAVLAGLILAASVGTAIAQTDGTAAVLPAVTEAPQVGTAMSATPMPMVENGYMEQELFLEGGYPLPDHGSNGGCHPD